MSMRRKNKALNPNMTDTLVGAGSTVEGKITSKAGLRIEGRVVGDVHCEGDVTIGEHGKLESNIHARNVYNAGVVEGSVVTRGMLTITPTGRVIGDIDVQALSIAQGGVFQGQSRMEIKPELSNAPAAAADAAAKDRNDRKSRFQKLEKEAVNK
jgi:cytoskeletal protein CcmA (bactofilin family)